MEGFVEPGISQWVVGNAEHHISGGAVDILIVDGEVGVGRDVDFERDGYGGVAGVELAGVLSFNC